MSQGPKYQINNHNTNIFIINSGDSNQKIGSLQNSSYVHFNQSSSGAKLISNSRTKPGNRSFLDFPFSEGEDEITNKMADDISGRSLDMFTPSGSLNPSSKMGLEPSHRNKNSYDDSSLLEFESIRRVRPKSPTGKVQKPRAVNEEDGGNMSEPFSFVPEPTLELENQRSLPKVTHLTSSTALALIQYKEASNQKIREVEKKAQADLGPEMSPRILDPIQPAKNEGKNKKGIVTNPKKQQKQKKANVNKKTKDGDVHIGLKTRVWSWFSKIFKAKPAPKAVGTSKLAINEHQLALINDVSEQHAILRRHGPRKTTWADPSQNKKTRLPRLISFMIRLAGDPESKEGEVFSKILSRLQPQKLEQYNKKYKKKWQQYFIGRCFGSVLGFFLSVHSPDSAFLIWWNFFGLILVVFNCFYVPFLASFLFSYHGISITIPLNIFFAVDILLAFRTAYYSKGGLVVSSTKIIRHNLNLGTLLDLCSVFFGVFYLFDLEIPMLKYLTFITLYRGFKMTHYIQRIEEHFQFDRVVTGLLKLLRLVLFIYIVAHVGGCVFYLIGTMHEGSQAFTWLRIYANTYTSTIDVYILALYWSFTTMITVGYGDITPQNVYEQIYTIVMMAMAGGVFGYSLNTIGQVVDEVTEASANSREKIRQITKYMKRKRLSRAVQMRVRKYLEYILEGEMVHREEEETLLGMLSDQLKDEIVAEIHVKALMDLSVLSLSFTQRFLTVLAKNMKEITLSPDQVIFKDGDSSDHAIYYVTAGNVHLYLERCSKIIKTLGRGEFFGEISFFSNRERTAAARSLNFSSVFQLKRENFLEVVQDFPTDKETFYNIQDKILFEKDFSILGITCFNCQEMGHISLNCPKGHFFVSEQDNQEAFRAFIDSGKKLRATFKRKEPTRFHPWLCLEKLYNDSIRIRGEIPNIESLPLHGVHDQYDNFSDDSFEEVLDRKIYGKKTKEPMNTEPVIDSLDSVEGHPGIGSLKIHREWSQRDSMYPFQPTGSKGVFAGTLANINSHPFPLFHGSTGGGDGTNSPERRGHALMGSTHFPSTQQFKANIAGNLYDTVCNYESYYTHGNINVISQKVNLAAMERLIQGHFEKKGKVSVGRNALKAIDILSRGSVFGSLRRESSEANQSRDKIARKKTGDIAATSELAVSRMGSVLSGFQGSGFIVPASGDVPNRRLSIFKTGSRRGSVMPGQPETSLISNGSYTHMEPPDHEEMVSPILRPSRFSYLRAAENLSPLKKQENEAPVPQNNLAENPQENAPKPGLSGGLSIRSSGYTLGNPSSSSLKMRRNSGSRDDKSSSETLRPGERGTPGKNSFNPQRGPQRQDSSRTESYQEHTVLGGINSDLTFQQKNSDDASSYHHESKVEILKHLWKAMEVISKRNASKDLRKGGRVRRSNSVGAQAKTEKLLEEFGLKEVLNEFLKLSANKDFFMKDEVF